MDEQETIDIVRRQHAAIAAGDIAGAAALFSDPTRNHGRAVPRGAVLAVLDDIRTTFPDWTLDIEAIAAAGPNVMARCRFRGMHLGIGRLPVNGGMMVGVAPTGRQVDVQHIHWYVLGDGLIAEHWANRDDLGMMQQLGLLSAPTPGVPGSAGGQAGTTESCLQGNRRQVTCL